MHVYVGCEGRCFFFGCVCVHVCACAAHTDTQHRMKVHHGTMGRWVYDIA
jgi:hypothetical protein